jgi:hypothetical protein
LPSLEQVGEWQHNLTPIQAQVKILREICKYIETKSLEVGKTPNIYYSVENNTVGEAALVAINEMGEESIPGMFLSEPLKKGHVRRFRRGFNTTHNSKISACSKAKQLIEKKQLKIYSKSLISELKTFVAAGITFKAKNQEYDDLVSALLLAVRMIVLLGEWDPVIYNKMIEDAKMDDYDLPMPIYISNY